MSIKVGDYVQTPTWGAASIAKVEAMLSIDLVMVSSGEGKSRSQTYLKIEDVIPIDLNDSVVDFDNRITKRLASFHQDIVVRADIPEKLVPALKTYDAAEWLEYDYPDYEDQSVSFRGYVGDVEHFKDFVRHMHKAGMGVDESAIFVVNGQFDIEAGHPAFSIGVGSAYPPTEETVQHLFAVDIHHSVKSLMTGVSTLKTDVENAAFNLFIKADSVLEGK